MHQSVEPNGFAQQDDQQSTSDRQTKRGRERRLNASILTPPHFCAQEPLKRRPQDPGEERKDGNPSSRHRANPLSLNADGLKYQPNSQYVRTSHDALPQKLESDILDDWRHGPHAPTGKDFPR